MAVPTFIDPGFTLLLVCIFLLGIGTTFLQVAGNPIMRDVSAEGNYSRNLALVQGIKRVSGSSAYSGLSGWIGFNSSCFCNYGLAGVFPVFLLFMVLAFVFVATLKIEETKADVPPSIGSSLDF